MNILVHTVNLKITHKSSSSRSVGVHPVSSHRSGWPAVLSRSSAIARFHAGCREPTHPARLSVSDPTALFCLLSERQRQTDSTNFVLIMEPELFDVILGTLTERGHIHAWKSELMYQAVKPLYETGVIPRRKVDFGENRNVLKLRLLMDLLAQLGLDNTRKMLLSEVDVGDEDLEVDIPDLAGKRENTDSPVQAFERNGRTNCTRSIIS